MRREDIIPVGEKGLEGELPHIISAMNSDSPMPTGAMKVARCFSLASMKMVNTSCAVKNISMNKPCTTVVGPPRVVATLKPVG